jgi:hypothetical protein
MRPVDDTGPTMRRIEILPLQGPAHRVDLRGFDHRTTMAGERSGDRLQERITPIAVKRRAGSKDNVHRGVGQSDRFHGKHAGALQDGFCDRRQPR